MKTCAFSLFLFFFTVFPVQALECSTAQGCYRPGAEIAGPDCSCPWIDGGDNSRCIEGGCPQIIDCQWSDWSVCSVKCGGGIQTRTIEVQPQNGGKECPGSDTQTCNTDPCPWRRGECNTDIGEYTCIQVGQDEETAGPTTYETEEECREDTENKCIKDISDEVEKVMGDCWNRRTYSFMKRNSFRTGFTNNDYVVGDANNDGYDDIVALKYKTDDDPEAFLQVLENIRKGDGSFDKLSIGTTMNLPDLIYYSRTHFINIGKYGSISKNRIIIGEGFHDPWIEGSAKFKINEYGSGDNWENVETYNCLGDSYLGPSYTVDINGDGYDDMVLNSSRSPKWFLFEGSGDENIFSGFTKYTTQAAPYVFGGSIDFGDFWGNGKKGIAWKTGSSSSASVKINVYANKNNLLSSPIEIISKYHDVNTLVVDDFNGDGLDDIAVGGGWGGSFIEIYETEIDNGNLKFNRVKEFKVTDISSFGSMISTDFDGDGIKDIVAVGRWNGDFVVVKGNKDSNYGISGSITTSDELNFDITVANFDNVGGDDFVIFTRDSALVYLNKCTPSGANTCNTCEGEQDNKSKGDANCDGKIDLADFEVWRSESFDINDEDYDWKADFDCSDELQKPDLEDLGIWIKNYGI